MGSRTYSFLTLIFAALLSGPLSAQSCRDDAIWLRGDWGSVRLRVEVADDAEERAQGLMFVEQMPPGAGMLFVYETERPTAFWMKNTLIPLDMIFADAQGRVVKVHQMAIPHDETPIPSGGPVQYVLEINGGMAAQLGIAEGTEMMHPAISGDPVWPCE
ncbi:DUF192 domain-containing protein [Salipiger bermudensis]|uniref:DUF192 domain-containing protein n=1 Tax=Salipiger bermudensis TaxID=344736 RepID=UPI001C99DEDC|nr:DUF192 domain-containing protein [Salipiger bermudensis]MBY6005911.1 DUF192 domain-containing protein [Salipiger bermudensis]